MPRQNPPLPEGLGKAFINTLMEEFANERKMTLKEYLQDQDQRIDIEMNYLDAPPFRGDLKRTEGVSEEEFNEHVRADYQSYRDNKRWLYED